VQNFLVVVLAATDRSAHRAEREQDEADDEHRTPTVHRIGIFRRNPTISRMTPK